MKDICKKLVSLLLCISTLLVFASCGDDETTENTKPASYGSYGADFARQLASEHPYRKAYSDGEKSTGIMIKEEFEALGYEVEVQEFNSIYGSQSANYVIRIEGNGFIKVNDDDTTEDVRRLVVIGAHYDDSFKAEEIPEGYSYDGISDNASAIGCLMTIASEIKNYNDLAFDVEIVAFGAGGDNFAGANFYYNSLSAEEKASIEVMYCIENIYAGDKMYANSGLNSLVSTQKYQMRRKLYQAYDVAYDQMLSSLNGYNLLYNECGLIFDINGDGVNDIYREVSINKSDYVVFDNANIPVVFFDSGDYFFDSLEKMKETKNLNFQEFGGQISNTYLDSSTMLDEVLKTEEKDILEIRINNTAFVILESLGKGSDFALTPAQYEQYKNTPVTSETTAVIATESKNN